jgi:hypothetical protein
VDKIINRFFDSFDKIIDLAGGFRRFARLGAFVLVLAVALIIFLSYAGKLTSERTTYALAGLFLLALIILILGFIDMRRRRPPRKDGSVTIVVHEAGNKTRWIEGAEVRVIFPSRNIVEKTNPTGTVTIPFPGDYANKVLPASAHKDWYLPSDPDFTIRLVNNKTEYIPLKHDPELIRRKEKEAGKCIMLRILSPNPGGVEIRRLKQQAQQRGLSEADFDEVFAELRDVDRCVAEVITSSADMKYITREGCRYLSNRCSSY